MKKNIDFILKTPIAHRGLHNEKAPENSLAAFKLAVAHGNVIELDVHMLADGKVVVFHDDNLKRMTGVDAAIKDEIYDELSGLRLKDTKEKIPLLTEALDLIKGKVPVIIEIKYDRSAREICPALIKIMSDYAGQFVVKSFDPKIVFYFRRKAPYIGRGQLATKKNFFLQNLYFNFLTKPDFISYDIRYLPKKRVEKIRRKIPVLGWTVRNKNDLACAKKYCDNYIFENISI
jgi:glycerophosphoryl diester phosphodiesterase